MDDEARKALLEQAYELAEYIHKHPAKGRPLRDRVDFLTDASKGTDAELDALVEAVEGWLEQFKMQGKE